MANLDAPRGLEPVGEPMRLTPYAVLATNAAKIHIGTPVAIAAAGTVDIIAGAVVLGPVVGIIAPDAVAFNLPYVPVTCGAGYEVIVADHPQQRFKMQEDGLITPLALEDRGEAVDMITGTGNDNTGLSGWEINSDSVNTTVTLHLRLIELVREPDNVIGANANWIVQINNHQLGPGVLGVPI